MITAGQDITSSGPVTLQTEASGELILVCDALFPNPPTFGTGNASLPNATLMTSGGKLLIYTAQRELNTMPTVINGTPYIPGPEAVNSTTEKWGVYYPNSSGIPFTIFYKTPTAIPPTPPTPPTPIPSTIPIALINHALHSDMAALKEPFEYWLTPWYICSFMWGPFQNTRSFNPWSPDVDHCFCKCREKQDDEKPEF